MAKSQQPTAALPNIAKHFAAHAFFARLATGHHAFRSSEDVDPQPAEDAWNLIAADVHAAAGTGDALHVRDCGFVIVAVLQVDAQDLAAFFFCRLEVGDETLFLEDAGDLQLQLGSGRINLGMPCAHGVADARQEVCYGIGGQTHLFLLYCPFARRAGTSDSCNAKFVSSFSFLVSRKTRNEKRATLPGRFRNPGDLTLERQAAEAQ